MQPHGVLQSVRGTGHVSSAGAQAVGGLLRVGSSEAGGGGEWGAGEGPGQGGRGALGSYGRLTPYLLGQGVSRVCLLIQMGSWLWDLSSHCHGPLEFTRPSLLAAEKAEVPLWQNK